MHRSFKYAGRPRQWAICGAIMRRLFKIARHPGESWIDAGGVWKGGGDGEQGGGPDGSSL